MKLFESERDFTRWVLKEARSRGWLAAHLGNVQIRRGHGGIPVPVPDPDAKGFPDLVLVHDQLGVVWAELKMPDRGGRPGALRPEQIVWLRALRATGETVYVWGPSDQNEIADVLDGERSGSRLFEEAGV